MVMPCSRSAARPSTSRSEIERAVAPAVPLQRRDLVVGQHPAVVEQPPDQGRFAVVDRAAGDEAQHRLVARRGGAILNGLRRVDPAKRGGHQKYPSSFFFSMLEVWSWSIARPWRSEVREAAISAITSGSVAASLSIAPVSG